MIMIARILSTAARTLTVLALALSTAVLILTMASFDAGASLWQAEHADQRVRKSRELERLREENLRAPGPSLYQLSHYLLAQSLGAYAHELPQSAAEGLKLTSVQVHNFASHEGLRIPSFFGQHPFGTGVILPLAFLPLGPAGVPLSLASIVLAIKYRRYGARKQDTPFVQHSFYCGCVADQNEEKVKTWWRQCCLKFEKNGQQQSVEGRLRIQMAKGTGSFESLVQSAQNDDEVPILGYMVDKFKTSHPSTHQISELADLKKAPVYGFLSVKRHEDRLYLLHHTVHRRLGANRTISFIQPTNDVNWVALPKDDFPDTLWNRFVDRLDLYDPWGTDYYVPLVRAQSADVGENTIQITQGQVTQGQITQNLSGMLNEAPQLSSAEQELFDADQLDSEKIRDHCFDLLKKFVP